MKVALYGGQTTGIISLLTLLSTTSTVKAVIAQDKSMQQIATLYSLDTYSPKDINTSSFIQQLVQTVDLLICCHGRKLLSTELVTSVPCINIHPCLYAYKGAQPIKRLIEEKNSRASVASHWMTPVIDEGKVIIEKFIHIENIETANEADVYRQLYPLYCEVLLVTLKKIKGENHA